MRIQGLIGMLCATSLVTGCGTTLASGSASRGGTPAALTAAAIHHAKATRAIGMREAFQTAARHVATTYGDDFKPIVAIADAAFDAQGQPLPTTWRFTMAGHLRGQTAYSGLKVRVAPDNTASVDAKTGGPFPDNGNWHAQPSLDLLTGIAPEAGIAMVMTGFASKYVPGFNFQCEMSYSDRLGQVLLNYYWATKVDGKASAYCETSLDPVTGSVVENDVGETQRRPSF